MTRYSKGRTLTSNATTVPPSFLGGRRIDKVLATRLDGT
jgi:hypothetical protein